MNYYKRLKTLNVESLELRRIHLDLLYTYKILFGLVDVKANELFKSLHVPTAIDLSVSVNDIMKLQAEDETLKSIRQQVQPHQNSEKQDETYFFIDKGLLFRQHQEKKGVTRKQLVLPKTMRSHVMKIAHESTMAGHQGM